MSESVFKNSEKILSAHINIWMEHQWVHIWVLIQISFFDLDS